MNAPTKTQPIETHRTQCLECDGSGTTTGYSCCGGQGCGCEKTCWACDGEGSVEGYARTDINEIADAEHAKEHHDEADGDETACFIDECPWCAAEQARRGAVIS